MLRPPSPPSDANAEAIAKEEVELRAAEDILGDIRGRTVLVLIGCLICQMGLACGYVFGPLAKDILDEMGWARGDYSFARVPQLAVMAFASPVVGTLVIRYGGRRVLMLSVAILGSAFLLIANLDGLFQYYALMMMMGLGLAGVGDITVGQIVSQWVTRRRGLALSIVYVGSNLGGVLLVPLAVAIAERTDWRSALLAMGVGAFVIMLPASIFLVRDFAVVQPAGAEEEAEPIPNLIGSTDLSLREALATRSFWILLYALFTFFFYFLALLEHLVLFLTDEGMQRGDAVAAYAVAIGLGIWSKLGLGLVADRIEARSSLLIVYSGLAASSLILLALPEGRLLWAFVVTFGFSYAARDVVYPLIITSCFGLGYMAQIYGVLMIMLVMGAVGPWFAATIHDRMGSYDLAFQIFAVLNGIAVVALFGLRDERVRRSP